MHALFLVPLASLATWFACRWWYRGQLRALERSLSVEEPKADADQEDPKPDAVPWTTWPSGGAANPGALRLSSLGGGPVLPFLDTSPLSHLEEPDLDLFAHVADSGAKGGGERPYLN